MRHLAAALVVAAITVSSVFAATDPSFVLADVAVAYGG